MRYGRTIELDLSYEDALAKARDAFRQQGFGTLTEIDVRKTLKEKLGLEMEDYIILGACNPQLAHRALEIEQRHLRPEVPVYVGQGDPSGKST